MELLVSSGSTHLRVIGIYRPPSSRKRPLPTHLFFDEFSSLLESAVLHPGKLIIAGDFNFHMNNVNKDSDASIFMDLLQSFGLVQHVVGPTHERGHLLDLIITRHDDELAIELPSDHALVTSRLTPPRPKPTRVLVNQRHLQQLSTDDFAEAIRSSSLLSDQPPDLSSLSMRYNIILRELLDEHAPQRTRYVTLRPHAPWFDNVIRKGKLTKRRLERKWRSTRLEVDRQIYRDYCVGYCLLLDQAKTLYHTNKQNGLHSKSLFQEVDKMVHGKKPKILPSSIPDDELANVFADHFRNKIQSLKHATEPENDFHQLQQPWSGDLLIEFSQLDPDAVRSIIMNSPSKSCSLDPIPTSLLKNFLNCLLPVIMNIVNLSLSSATVMLVSSRLLKYHP